MLYITVNKEPKQEEYCIFWLIKIKQRQVLLTVNDFPEARKCE